MNTAKQILNMTQEELDAFVAEGIDEFEKKEEKLKQESMKLIQSPMFIDFFNNLTQASDFMGFINSYSDDDTFLDNRRIFQNALHLIKFDKKIRVFNYDDYITYGFINGLAIRININPYVLNESDTSKFLHFSNIIDEIYSFENIFNKLIGNDDSNLKNLFSEIEIFYLKEELKNIKKEMYDNYNNQSDKNYMYIETIDTYYDENYKNLSKDLYARIKMFANRI